MKHTKRNHKDTDTILSFDLGKLAALPAKIAKNLKAVSDEIKDNVAAVQERDPAARNKVEVLLLYSGVHAILAYRVAHKRKEASTK